MIAKASAFRFFLFKMVMIILIDIVNAQPFRLCDAGLKKANSSKEEDAKLLT
jgi:hypothetical protein